MNLLGRRPPPLVYIDRFLGWPLGRPGQRALKHYAWVGHFHFWLKMGYRSQVTLRGLDRLRLDAA